jgi:hypothetical protein
VRDPLKGWTRKHTALADTFSIQDAAVACTGACLQLVEVGQPGVAAQVAGGVDHGLDAERPAVFEVLLDPRVLVEDVDDHALIVAAVDRGPKHPLGVAADLAAEDDLHVAGRPMSRLSAISASKNPRAWRGASNTMVRQTSICRIEHSHQSPASRSASPKGSGSSDSHRW